jgi:hypothetical protein
MSRGLRGSVKTEKTVKIDRRSYELAKRFVDEKKKRNLAEVVAEAIQLYASMEEAKEKFLRGSST